jgi:hypothetical protein
MSAMPTALAAPTSNVIGAEQPASLAMRSIRHVRDARFLALLKVEWHSPLAIRSALEATAAFDQRMAEASLALSRSARRLRTSA